MIETAARPVVFFVLIVGLLAGLTGGARPVVAAPYTLGDLNGTWELNGLAAGPGAPWWIRGPVSIAADGSFTSVLTENDQTQGNVTGTFSITAEGVIALPELNPNFQGAMDTGRSVVAATSIWTGDWYPGTLEMIVMLRKADSYGLADLAGTWEVNIVASGPGAPWWERGPLAVSTDGSFSGTMEQYDSDLDIVSGVFNISSDGMVTMVGDTDEDYQCAMDSGKTVVACTGTWSTGVPGTSEMSVWVKTGPAYSTEDLVGTWELQTMDTRNLSPDWSRGTMTIGPGGTFSAALTRSDQVQSSVSGTLAITGDGVVTFIGQPEFRAAMDADKTVIVGTNTWRSDIPDSPEPIASEIYVMVKTAAPTPRVRMPWLPMLLDE